MYKQSCIITSRAGIFCTYYVICKPLSYKNKFKFTLYSIPYASSSMQLTSRCSMIIQISVCIIANRFNSAWIHTIWAVKLDSKDVSASWSSWSSTRESSSKSYMQRGPVMLLRKLHRLEIIGTPNVTLPRGTKCSYMVTSRKLELINFPGGM